MQTMQKHINDIIVINWEWCILSIFHTIIKTLFCAPTLWATQQNGFHSKINTPFLRPLRVVSKSSSHSATLTHCLHLHLWNGNLFHSSLSFCMCSFLSFLYKKLASQLELSSMRTESDAPAGKENSPLCRFNRGATSNGKHHHRLPQLQRER